MTSPLTPEAVAQMVADMADGLDMAAEAEVLVIDGLAKYADMFLADDRDPKTMRALRVYNEAKSNHRRFVTEAAALRTLAAENATLRAENEVLTKSGIIEVAVRNPSVMDYIKHWEGRTEKAEAELTTLRASEAAAMERVKVLGTVLQRSTEGWANALELGLIPERHRNTAFILRDAGFAALTPPKTNGETP